MLKIFEWIITNWKTVGTIGIIVFLFSISGNLTQTIRGFKNGMKEFVTPLGFFILVVLGLILFFVLKETGLF